MHAPLAAACAAAADPSLAPFARLAPHSILWGMPCMFTRRHEQQLAEIKHSHRATAAVVSSGGRWGNAGE
jgi:hypothetical protein